jgi:hypothetical protein
LYLELASINSIIIAIVVVILLPPSIVSVVAFISLLCISAAFYLSISLIASPVKVRINQRWAINLPYYLVEVFVCNLIGHKPAKDLEFVPGLCMCERCMSPLKRDKNGTWRGSMAQVDIVPGYTLESTTKADKT